MTNRPDQRDCEAPEFASCPECGASWTRDEDCDSMLAVVTAWEWDHPPLAALHFITVATFNLQHPARFTDAAIESLRHVYIRHLDEGLPVSEIRRIHRGRFEGRERVQRPVEDRRPVLLAWPLTIADVRAGAAEEAYRRVLLWARSTRLRLT